LPNIKSAEKRVRTAEKRRLSNKSARSQVKTSVSKAGKLIAAGEMAAAPGAVVAAVSALDKAAEKGILHANNAARRKSRLVRKLNSALKSAEAKTERAKEE